MSVGLYTMIFILLLPYALLRWGSGREIVVGLPIIVVAYALGIAADYTNVGRGVRRLRVRHVPAVSRRLVRFSPVPGAGEGAGQAA